MEEIFHQKLLVFVWQYGLFDQDNLFTASNEKVTILNRGCRGDEGYPDFRDANIVIGDVNYVGDITVNVNATDWSFRKRNLNPRYDGVILNIVENEDGIVHKINNSTLPSLKITYPKKLQKIYESLLKNAGDFGCGNFLRREINDVNMRNVFARLMVERLERKCRDVMKIYKNVDDNWHETFHVMLFSSMGMNDKSKKELYTSLALSLPYSTLCTARGEIENVEAMIFGVGGHLDNRTYNEYKERLKERFDILSQRNKLKILEYCQWTEKGVRPFNFSTIRLAQLASLINEGLLTFDNVLAAERISDLRRLFDINLPAFWRRSFDFNTRSNLTRGKLTDEMIDIMMINLVTPIIFAYAHQTENQVLKDRAIEFLETIRPESNKYTKRWKASGIEPENAFYSQAIIQLSVEYCNQGRCTECFIGMKMLKNA